LGARTVIEEPHYFDRDYLAEFKSFYSQSTYGYPNTCRRLHVFKSKFVDRRTFLLAARNNSNAISFLNRKYLGFIVVRPIHHAPLGRTVLRWYPDDDDANPRRTEPSRQYVANLAGLQLEVRGLAWQQQDQGVAACATVATWTVLQSSAFDDFHHIPTTADITLNATNRESSGRRPFPAKEGLTPEQLCEAIKANKLAPLVIAGDFHSCPFTWSEEQSFCFTRQRFSSICGAYIRSGYPLLLYGRFVEEYKNPEDETCYRTSPDFHTMCVVGFREKSPANLVSDEYQMSDGEVEAIYLHDDNLGPSVRFKISDEAGAAVIKPEAPKRSGRREIHSNYERFLPSLIVAAVHEDLSISPSDLMVLGERIATVFQFTIKGMELPAVFFGARFIKLPQFLRKDLADYIKDPEALAEVRVGLQEKAPPLSLHVGLLRFAIGSTPIVDVICDTTNPNIRVFAHIVYSEFARSMVKKLTEQWDNAGFSNIDSDLGVEIFPSKFESKSTDSATQNNEGLESPTASELAETTT
jgi:hypothetical protein